MTRDEAEERSVALTADHPDRETHRFLPRQNAAGDWEVVKIGLPPADDGGAAEVRADEKPPTPDDPRESLTRNLGPYAAGG